MNVPIFFGRALAKPFGLVGLIIVGLASLLPGATAKGQTLVNVEPFQLPATPRSAPRSVWRLRGASYLEDPWHRLPASQLQGVELPRSLQVDPYPDPALRL
jgi:hypothetical protein